MSKKDYPVSEDELNAGIEALLESERSGLFFGPTDDQRVHAVLNAVLPSVTERVAAEAVQDAAIMITAITMASGGRLAVPMNLYESAQGAELVRYDDPGTMSVIFETPIPDVA